MKDHGLELAELPMTEGAAAVGSSVGLGGCARPGGRPGQAQRQEFNAETRRPLRNAEQRKRPRLASAALRVLCISALNCPLMNQYPCLPPNDGGEARRADWEASRRLARR